MAIDLTGITNENEFYTHHYLGAILEGDLKREVFEKWKEKEEKVGFRPPAAALRTLSRDYLQLRNELERIRKTELRRDKQRTFFQDFLSILGYAFAPDLKELDDGSIVPVLQEIKKPSGAPELWIIEALDLSGEGEDPLTLCLHAGQYPEGVEAPEILLEAPLDDIITRRVFGRSEPPRWVILISDAQILLLDRGKWNEKRLLRFNFAEIFGRKEPSTLQAMAALLHRDSICPADGMNLLDQLDENSHRHAFAVSEDLKYTIREAIELIGNEAVWYLREKLKEKVYGRDLAEDLTKECLRFMYRLLFLFYIEARPELGYVPLKADAYRNGYGIEFLRDLELVKLTTEESRNGYFFHDSLRLLFDLIYRGWPPTDGEAEPQLHLEGTPDHHIFQIPALRSHLFDPARTPILNRVKFRNAILQRVIEHMSLTRPEGAKDRRGRISYAQLGINQLGAVYEALLSYRGFFAEDDLYEVKQADEPYNELETAYFVKAGDLPKYTDEEKVYKSDGKLKMYSKGTFIYRLAGREREKSASYYTPEVLTRCLVKYALKELVKDKTADDILKLTICEPAMGSAAFLNETVNQLADVYLDRKQRETGIRIKLEDYTRERQKVRTFIADRNVFGVDLNPIAVELAEVSLWLNTLYGEAFVPWFGMQLVTGNSLIGARRQVFNIKALKKNDSDPLWLDIVPERIHPGDGRESDTVYHYLLPDRGMADYKEKVVRDIVKPEIKKISQWRKTFTRPFIAEEIEQLTELSTAIDLLYTRHTKQQRNLRQRTIDPLAIFGQPEVGEKLQGTTTAFKDGLLEKEIFTKDNPSSSPYRRLKLVMDYWCALWFWPIEKASLLPTREEFLLDCSLILKGNVFAIKSGENAILFSELEVDEEQKKHSDAFGFVNVDQLCDPIEGIPRLALVKAVSEKYRFHHWEIEYADIFSERGGFDLVLGNPPWIKVEWDEGGMMGDYDPIFIIKNYSAPQIAALRAELMKDADLKQAYLLTYEEAESTQNYLNAYHNYPLLRGMKANLYKCFITQSWLIGNKDCVTGFLHPEGIYDDPHGGLLRGEMYPRLRYHFQFQNGLNLFADVAHREKYSINIYSNIISDGFIHVSNLFHTRPLELSFAHDGSGICLGIKDENNEWNLNGHRDRIISVTSKELALFADLYDEPGTPALHARLPVIHAAQIVRVLNTFVINSSRIRDLKGEYISTQMWNETTDQKMGIIQRETKFPASANQLILSGPHFYVANPLYKTPRSISKEKADYDPIDLTDSPDSYLPRTNYLPRHIDDTSNNSLKVPWADQRSTDTYRLALRAMLPPPNERTLVSAIIQKLVGHINSVQSIAFKDIKMLLAMSCFCSSLVADFIIKSTGRTNLHYSWETFPLINMKQRMTLNTLMLNSLTIGYAELWEAFWKEEYRTERWTKNDPRLINKIFSNLTPKWNRNCAYRTDYERRYALIEIDVLVAMVLGMTSDELNSIYRVQFPVLYQNEADTWYDQTGRIVFTISKGLPGVGYSRPEWNDIKDMKSGTVSRTIIDDTLPGGPQERTIVYQAPFDRCDREHDYEIAWSEFERRGLE